MGEIMVPIKWSFNPRIFKKHFTNLSIEIVVLCRILHCPDEVGAIKSI